uniref:MYND-type domain-containing protein n=1 Tax=Anopheles dirus TaxID=7168 RepID=A0A182NUN6_9DIPT
MEVSSEEGYFHRYAQKFRRAIAPKERERFAALGTDRERYAFVSELKWRVVDELPLERSLDDGKCLDRALEHKATGDRLFQQDEDWVGALKCYNQCYLLLPEDNVLEKALLLDSRSQALLQLGKLDQTLEDIDRAIAYGYPAEQLATLWERKARIFQSRKDFKTAVECFDKTVHYLTHRTALSTEQLAAKLEELKKLTDVVYYQYKNVQKYLEPAKGPRSFQPHLDGGVQYDSSEADGRFAKAKTNLRPNQLILREKPHAAALTKEYSGTHCSHCFERIEVLHCCPSCTDVAFCSGRCERNGCGSYHRYECGFLQSLWSSGASIVSLLALRIITQKPSSYFDDIREELPELTASFTDKLPDDDYRKVFRLVTHSDKRSPEDYLVWTLMATMLNSVLRMSNYNTDQPDNNFLGYLLLHNLQIVNYNAHDVSEVQRKHSNDPGLSVAIGAALYPMLALFNHSCDPGIVRYFTGTTVHVRTIKNIAAGAIIAENYGPLYTRMSRPERRQTMASNYKFDCNCQACEADWPTCAEMDHSLIRFRCTGGADCKEAVQYDLRSDSHGVRCTACGHIVDVGERIRVLREANMLSRFNEASQLYQAGSYEHALSKYAAIMITMDEVLAPPYRDYHICQQGMRRCCLDLGSCYVSCPSTEKYNEERFRFVNGLRSIVDELRLKREYNGKGMEQATALKTLGNKAFQAERWNEALVFYNKCYVSTPKENVQEKSIILANRSAALYHLEKYDLALRDIQRALAHQYPNQMMYKLTERKARCFLAKKDYEAALECFKATVTALDDSNLPLERRQKLERDAQIMINLLPTNIEMEKKNRKKASSKADDHATGPTAKTPDHFVEKALWFDETADEGRFARTSTDLKPNTILLLERPHVSTLLEDYSLDHCTHCFKRVSVPIACPLCADVIFCSDECEAKANSSYHRYECGFLPILWGSGASITCHMALRMITQKSEEYFMKLKPELAALTNEQIDKLAIDDYRKVYKLVTHESTRSPEDFFQRTLMATLLNTCLTLGGYGSCPREENFIGGLLVHNLQLLQFNAHEVSEIIRDTPEDIGKSTFIGGGLYPTLALFNHSCDPGVTRYYRGNQVCVRTVKNIPADAMVAENYGPLFTQVRREERHETLLNQYRFTCQCVPCMENWPLFTEMDPTVIRFRCDGGKICSNVLIIPSEINDFMVQCTECGEHTNIMKGLKSVQDTDMLFKTATRLHTAGEYEAALRKYVEMMETMSEVLVPPYRDYHLCQQGLRACMLEFGNRFTRAVAKK